MIDYSQIKICGGKGGDGAVSGRREKFVPQGGPDGGDGGDGGSVFVQGDRNVSTLQRFRYNQRFEASDGGKGERRKRKGSDGEDICIRVPLGTQLWNKNEAEELVADIVFDGQRELLIAGGKGGLGNVHFKSSTNQYPVLAQAGETAVEMDLRLELKLLADVGIIGAPNAGKSTLLTRLSGARPKIGDYPFTTIEPVLGVVDHRGERIVGVDIPGLMEGASQGTGLGTEFLRHIERTRVLVHLVDGSAPDPSALYCQTNSELSTYGHSLEDKLQVVVVSKTDIVGGQKSDTVEGIVTALTDLGALRIYSVSAATGEGIDEMLDAVMIALVEETRNTTSVSEEPNFPTLRPRPRKRNNVEVKIEEGVFVVQAPSIERVASLLDPKNWTAHMQFNRYLMRTGVVQALENAGVSPGDTVYIGEMELEWE